MATDVTSEFRALVSKANANGRPTSGNSILRPAIHQTEFSNAVLKVRQQIKDSKDFFKETRERYINPGMISDKEKDDIEKEMVAFIKTCSTSVEGLSRAVTALQERRTIKETELSDQAIAHRHGMVLIISEELRELTLLLDKCRSERAIRIKALSDRRARQRTKQEKKLQEMRQDTVVLPGHGDGTLSQEQVGTQAMIQEESQALFEELTNLSTQVQNTEKMMQEIATLNQMLSTQIMGQTEQIDKIYSDAVQSSSNLRRGNLHLKKTVDLNKSTRRYILAILVIASLVLLFFDRFYS